jgi:mono/diheme cytochrome c family protein
MMKLLMVAAVLILNSAALAQDPLLVGHALLEEHCARCHAIGKGDDSPREGAPAFRTLNRSFNMDEFAGRLQRGLMAGHPAMPEFKFNEEAARAVTAYLRSIQE